MAKTKLPDLVIGDLIINPPIVQGGMGARVSASSLVSAVSNEGAFGVIASVGLAEVGEADSNGLSYEERSKAALFNMIHATKLKTKNSFGVNIMCALSNYDDLAKVSLEENVAAIISGAGLPLGLPALTQDIKSNTKLIPIVSSGRAADLICKTWSRRYNVLPDAFVLEGPLAGGHLGFKFTDLVSDELPLVENILPEVLSVCKKYESAKGKKIPVIVGGGVFTGKDIARLLKLGASGVQMATRFVCTDECDAPDLFKQAYINSTEKDIVIILSPVGLPARVIKNKFVERIESGEKIKFTCPYRCLKVCNPYSANYCIAQAMINAYKGNLEEGYVMCGANVHRIKKIVSVKELINELAEEFGENLYTTT
ncbi:MAG: nitronate monooxygenase [Candidatus Omnitrophica bacterium CG02_land_8_20_14_3_00__42_8]|nr:MAG: nitronate monooxygenase [Candidatus Omnitrophica bacterium CG02_land_8_20_14_3_00__42_8]